MTINEYLSKSIKWTATGDAELPFSSTVECKDLRIRLNDFPAVSLYTLLVGETEVNFDNWPSSWSKTTTKKAPKSTGITRGRLAKAI